MFLYKLINSETQEALHYPGPVTKPELSEIFINGFMPGIAVIRGLEPGSS